MTKAISDAPEMKRRPLPDIDLKELEGKTTYILREVRARLKNPAVMWSTGKDSTAMLGLIRNAFFGEVPWPVVHLDTMKKFPEIYDYRSKMAKELNLDLIVAKHPQASEISPGVQGHLNCCTALKVAMLKSVVKEHGFDALVMSIRRDEHDMRAIERSFCFPAESLVYTLNGPKPIQGITKGEKIFSCEGSIDTVEERCSRQYSGDMIEIKPDGGNEATILATPNHVFLAKVIRKEGKKHTTRLFQRAGEENPREVDYIATGTAATRWTAAEEIRRGDKLFVPCCSKVPQDKIKAVLTISTQSLIGTPEGTYKHKRTIRWRSAHKDANGFPSTIHLTPRICRMIGFYIAEGSFSKRTNQVSFGFGGHEIQFAEDVQHTIEKEFKLKCSIFKAKKRNAIQVVVSSKTFGSVMERLCGNGSINKHLPRFFMEMSSYQLRELIHGCWLGDGHLKRYSTISRTLAHEMRMGLLRLKILSYVSRQEQTGRRSKYCVEVAKVSIDSFKQLGLNPGATFEHRFIYPKRIFELVYPHPYTGKTTKSRIGGYWVRVVGTKHTTYDGTVFDLKTTNGSYVVNGCGVHNSPRTRGWEWKILREKTAEEMKDGDAPFVSEQQTELDGIYQTDFGTDCDHVRVHPILHWRELDVWRFLKQEGIQPNPLYFSGYVKKAYGLEGKRYRSLGCMPCTQPVDSKADTIDEIIEELRTTQVAERSGRSQDKEETQNMRRLRVMGYP